MTDTRAREELTEAELPAAEMLERLGYHPLSMSEAEALRDGPASAVLEGLALGALRRLNPWLDEDGARRALTSVTRQTGADGLEINEKVHTVLTFGTAIAWTDDKGRRRDRTVRFFDFDRPGDSQANRLDYVRQFRLRGPRQEIIADLVVFVNGFPLAVLEAKAPTLADPIAEAIDRFRRYQGLDEFTGLGAPRLFEVAQVLIGIAKDAAQYGTTATPPRYWAEWKEPFPGSREDLEHWLGRMPTAQDIALYGLLSPANLLDIIRNFVVFEIEDGVRMKKICRYQQFIAVQKAIERILRESNPRRRGGYIHHTQGSGKSLTMVFLALKLRRLPEAMNPTLVVVTDRRDLDQQITGTFLHCGFPNPISADSGIHLRDVLSGGAGPTVLSTVHKFHTAVPRTAPPITTAENVFVMVDEAHRTQYGALGARMRKGLPNATLIAFTGTPIDKKDRSTERDFGGPIHRYPIDQAVRDGATVPIHYAMRDARLRVQGKDLDREIRALYPDLPDAQFRDLLRRRSPSELVAGVPSRIEAVARDLVRHYRETIEPNGFKAQVVACSRQIAVAYKAALDDLGAPESVVIMSGSNDDSATLRAHYTTPTQREALVARFKKRDDPLKILIVCDMLLTGFDAPIEQVMYLDAPLREHTLLQAIARVNRTAQGKTHGLVVDYWGDAERIRDALALFSSDDIKGTLLSENDRFEQLRTRHRAAIRFFDGIDRRDDEACLALLDPNDRGLLPVFDIALKRFSEAMDMLLPNPKALEPPYEEDLKWLMGLRARARRRFERQEGGDLRGFGAKVAQLVEKYLSAEGVEELLEPVSILDPGFSQRLASLASDEARASEMEHAIRHEIHVHREENPALYESLWVRLEQLINDRRQAKVTAAAALADLSAIVEDASQARRSERAGGLSGTAGAIHGLLDGAMADEATRSAAAASITAALTPFAEVIDWHQKEDVQRQMRRAIKAELRKADVEPGVIEALTARVMDVARARLVR